MDHFTLNNLQIGGKISSIRFNTAHSSKGTEAEHVFLVDIISGTYGFPCEIDESDVLEIAKRNHISNQLEEERRLFYVALTRSKNYLYIYTREKNQSQFLKEIENYVQRPETINYIDFKSQKPKSPQLADFLD